MIRWEDFDKKDQLYKLWDAMGVDYKATRYLGDKFETFQDYLLFVADYHNIENVSFLGLISHIRQDMNEYLSNPENIPCGGDAEIRMSGIDIDDRQLYEKSYMSNLYEGMGGKPWGKFHYVLHNPQGFECEPIPGYSEKDMMEDFLYRKYKDTEVPSEGIKDTDEYKKFCFEESCFHYVIRDISAKIRKKYGISLNISGGERE